MTDDSETLGLIGDAARSFVRQWGGPARVRGRLDQSLVFDREEWKAVVEQGWLGLMVPEEKGGLGLSASALTVLLEQLGDGLVMSPVLPGIATAVVLASLDTAPADTLLSDLMSGKSLILTALPGDIEAPTLLPDAEFPARQLLSTPLTLLAANMLRFKPTRFSASSVSPFFRTTMCCWRGSSAERHDPLRARAQLRRNRSRQEMTYARRVGFSGCRDGWVRSRDGNDHPRRRKHDQPTLGSGHVQIGTDLRAIVFERLGVGRRRFSSPRPPDARHRRRTQSHQ